MNIYYDSKKLEKICNDTQAAVKMLGPENAKKLARRMNELRAAETLEDFCRLPAPRCHQLTNNRQGQFAADLKHPARLVFQPADEPKPLRPDGGLDRSNIRSVRILEVTDYHG